EPPAVQCDRPLPFNRRLLTVHIIGSSVILEPRFSRDLRCKQQNDKNDRQARERGCKGPRRPARRRGLHPRQAPFPGPSAQDSALAAAARSASSRVRLIERSDELDLVRVTLIRVTRRSRTFPQSVSRRPLELRPRCRSLSSGTTVLTFACAFRPARQD